MKLCSLMSYPPRFQGRQRPFGRAVLLIALLGVTAVPSAAIALESNTIAVTGDPGGSVAERVRQIEAMRRLGQKVAVPHGRCMSACTLYLGLPGTCVGKRAQFGFHGPRSATPGIGLPRAEFERWSGIMAAHYPAPIRRWFLQTGRYRTNGAYMISGAELIRLGVPDCHADPDRETR